MKKLQYRAVQIDLARQIEHMDVVLKYFDLAAEAGMNMVILYLEDRIRTKTYPYPPEGEAYSEDQIREMVAYADKLGLELVPVVSPVGHTERFLRFPELQHMAELRGNIAGRFTKAGEVKQYGETCPNLPETKAFMDAYFAEVAALFPSKYFHIGFDEIFNMGFCEHCKPIVEKDGLPVLFRDTLLYFYNTLKKLGKTVMIWDDMLEHCDSIIDDLPRDIVMCAWFYRFYQRYPEARFTTSRRYDLFKKFDRLGFPYFACTNIQIKSIDTLTEYAGKYEPLGMMMTNWELATQPNCVADLSVRYAGLLWNQGKRPCFETLTEAAMQVCSTPEIAKAIATVATYSIINRYSLGLPGVGAMELNRYELLKEESTMAMLEDVLKNVTETDGDMVQSFYGSVLHWRYAYLLRGVAYDLHQYRTGEIELDMDDVKARLAKARKQYETIEALNRKLWDNARKGIPSVRFENFLSGCLKALEDLEKVAETAAPGQIGRLDIHFSLPEYTSACKTKITLLYADGTSYQVGHGTYKADRNVYFDRTFAIPADKVPCALNLEVSGVGASGFCYADVILPGVGRLIPSAVTRSYGWVENPEYMLIDDFTSTICGNPEMLRMNLIAELAHIPHGFTVALEKE